MRAYPVPEILEGPINVILRYADDLTTTFTCTGFGGDDVDLFFEWSPSMKLNISSQTEVVNDNNITISQISTNILTLEERQREYMCRVRYKELRDPGTLVHPSVHLSPPESAILNIGKYIDIYMEETALKMSLLYSS